MTIRIPAVEGPILEAWMKVLGPSELLQRLKNRVDPILFTDLWWGDKPSKLLLELSIRLGPETFMGTLYEEFTDKRDAYWEANEHRIKNGDEYPDDWPELFKLAGHD